MPQQDHTEWMQRIMQWKEENPFLQKDGGCGVTPQLVMETLGELVQGISFNNARDYFGIPIE